MVERLKIAAIAVLTFIALTAAGFFLTEVLALAPRVSFAALTVSALLILWLLRETLRLEEYSSKLLSRGARNPVLATILAVCTGAVLGGFLFGGSYIWMMRDYQKKPPVIPPAVSKPEVRIPVTETLEVEPTPTSRAERSPALSTPPAAQKRSVLRFVGLKVAEPVVGEPLAVKIYLKNSGDKTLHVTGVSSIVFRSIEKGDNLDTLADELWTEVASIRSDVMMAMPPDLEVWPTIIAPTVTHEIQQRLQNKTAAVFVMGIFRYKDDNGEVFTSEMCTWLLDGTTHYTLCKRHNSI